MALSSSSVASSQKKRPLSTVDNVTQPSKKARISYHRHHSFHFKQQNLPGTEPALLGQVPTAYEENETTSPHRSAPSGQSEVDDFLNHSILSICQQVAVRDGIPGPRIESWALEQIRSAAEEFTLKLCQTVRHSMLAARRTVPIATDFETAFQILQIPTPEDQLPPILQNKPQPTLEYLPTPPPEDFFTPCEVPESFSGDDPSSKQSERREPWIPANFPPLPSPHTYRYTPVAPTRVNDPRRIRELVAEEGKLGEQALRKLAGAKPGEGKLDLGKNIEKGPHKAQTGEVSEKIEDVFEETMRALLSSKDTKSQESEGGFQMAPIVSFERKYWMPDSNRRRNVK